MNNIIPEPEVKKDNIELPSEEIKTPKREDTEGSSLTGQGQVKFLNEIVTGLLIVLFIGFATMFVGVATMFWNAWTANQSSYENLTSKVLEQNYKIDTLIHEINQQRSASTTPR